MIQTTDFKRFMKLSLKYLFIPFLLSAFNTLYVLLSDDLYSQTGYGVSIIIFASIFLTIACMDVALRYWAGKNIEWDSAASPGLAFREYAVFAAFILLIVNTIGIFMTGTLLRCKSDSARIIRVNLTAVPTMFLYYSLLKERLKNIISYSASDIYTSCESRSHIYLKASDGTVKKIFLNDIIFIQSMEKHIIIHSVADKEIVSLTLKKTLSMLPESMFVQTHRSYIVNRNRIFAITGDDMIVSGTVIPIGKNFRDSLLKSRI